MPRPGARSLSDGQLDGLMGQLAFMNNDKMRKDLLGESPVASSGRCLSHRRQRELLIEFSGVPAQGRRLTMPGLGWALLPGS